MRGPINFVNVGLCIRIFMSAENIGRIANLLALVFAGTARAEDVFAVFECLAHCQF